jgi:hypothetical protein
MADTAAGSRTASLADARCRAEIGSAIAAGRTAYEASAA